MDKATEYRLFEIKRALSSGHFTRGELQQMLPKGVTVYPKRVGYNGTTRTRHAQPGVLGFVSNGRAGAKLRYYLSTQADHIRVVIKREKVSRRG